MKRVWQVSVAVAATALCASNPASAYMSGISGYARTGCSGCHGAELPTTQVCISGFPADGFYDPNETYELEVSVTGTSIPPNGISRCDGGVPSPLAGFNLEVGTTSGQQCSGFASAGTLAKPASEPVSIFADPFCPEATQTLGGNRQTRWRVDWIPPTEGNEVFFFVAGNAVDGNCRPDSDFSFFGFPPIGDLSNRLGSDEPVKLGALPAGHTPSPDRVTVCNPALPAH